MKKLIAAAMVAVVVASVIVSAYCLCMAFANENNIRQAEYDAGFDDGIEWAIENMQLYTRDHYEAVAAAEHYEQTIYIDLGGVTYEHVICY